MSETVNAPVVETTDNVTTEVKTEVVANNPMELISEDLRKLPSLQKFKDLDSLAKSYAEIESKLGKRVEDLSAEDLRKLSKKLGAPEKAEDYEVNFKDTLGIEGLEAKALELGVPKDQLKGLAEFVKAEKEKSLNATKQDLEAKAKELKTSIPDYDSKEKLVNKALTDLAGEEVAKKLTEAGLGTDKAVFNFLAEVGSFLTEGGLLSPKNGVNSTTKEEAASILQQKMSDIEFKRAYNSASNPRHKEVVEEVTKLMRIANS